MPRFEITPKKSVTAKRLREVLDYDPKTGIFTRRISTCSRARAGKVAGSANGRGYLFIMVDGLRYQAHRLAWLYMMGHWPDRDLDHVDLCRSNNRWDNIRLATPSQNGANRTLNRNNRSGYKGVCWDHKDGAWKAHIRVGPGKRRYLGAFDCARSAHAAYAAASVEVFGEFARLR